MLSMPGTVLSPVARAASTYETAALVLDWDQQVLAEQSQLRLPTHEGRLLTPPQDLLQRQLRIRHSQHQPHESAEFSLPHRMYATKLWSTQPQRTPDPPAEDPAFTGMGGPA